MLLLWIGVDEQDAALPRSPGNAGPGRPWCGEPASPINSASFGDVPGRSPCRFHRAKGKQVRRQGRGPVREAGFAPGRLECVAAGRAGDTRGCGGISTVSISFPDISGARQDCEAFRFVQVIWLARVMLSLRYGKPQIAAMSKDLREEL